MRNSLSSPHLAFSASAAPRPPRPFAISLSHGADHPVRGSLLSVGSGQIGLLIAKNGRNDKHFRPDGMAPVLLAARRSPLVLPMLQV